jgi:hypothetical protein
MSKPPKAVIQTHMRATCQIAQWLPDPNIIMTTSSVNQAVSANLNVIGALVKTADHESSADHS